MTPFVNRGSHFGFGCYEPLGGYSAKEMPKHAFDFFAPRLTGSPRASPTSADGATQIIRLSRISHCPRWSDNCPSPGAACTEFVLQTTRNQRH